MKKQIFKVLLFTLLVSNFSLSLQAQVDWFADPNSSGTTNQKRARYFNNFDSRTSTDRGDCTKRTTQQATLSTTNASPYGKVWKITKPKNAQRGELARTRGFSHAEGSTRYYGWRWKIDSDAYITKDVTVWQWKTQTTSAGNQGRQNYPLNLEYGSGHLKLHAFRPCPGNLSEDDCPGSIVDQRTTLAKIRIRENEWVDIIIRIKKSTDENKGFVQFFINGTAQTLSNSDNKNYSAKISTNGLKAYLRTSDGDNVTDNVYPKWGIYNSASCSYKISTYLDEMRVGRTKDDASPSTHDDPSGKKANRKSTISEKSLQILPNPITDSFSIKVEGSNRLDVVITDLLGKMVYQKTTVNNTLNLNKGSVFRAGMYIVTVKDEFNNIYTSKLIVN